MWKDWRPLQIECRWTGYLPGARPEKATELVEGAGGAGAGIAGSAAGGAVGIGLGSAAWVRTGAREGRDGAGACEATAPDTPQAASSSIVSGASSSLLIIASHYSGPLQEADRRTQILRSAQVSTVWRTGRRRDRRRSTGTGRGVSIKPSWPSSTLSM